MTDLKNNLEEVWNQEYRDFMLSFYPESSPLVSTWEIYRMAKVKSQNGIESLRTQLLAQCKISRELLVEKEQLEQELQKTREQLVESNELLIDVRDIFQDKIFLLNINDSCFSRLRRWNNDSQKYIDKYFKEKDKQGE